MKDTTGCVFKGKKLFSCEGCIGRCFSSEGPKVGMTTK